MLIVFITLLIAPHVALGFHAGASGYWSTTVNARDSREVSAVVVSRGELSPSNIFELNRFGIVRSVIGRVATITTSYPLLSGLARLQFVQQISQSRSLQPSLDVSVPEIGAPAVWQSVVDRNGLPIDGSGVAIGLIDTGVDLQHPDFRFENGSSKILYVWDQGVSGVPPSGFAYGSECARSDIERGVCGERDTFGHGTHVAGIAGSTGLATNNFRGVAPGAGLIVVKSGRSVCSGQGWIFDDTQIIDGVNYVVRKARDLGMRVVVNLSLGGVIGGHDDTSAIELALDETSARGAVVVVSAGNEAQDSTHVSGRLPQGGSVAVGWSVKGEAKLSEVDIWYASRDVFDIFVQVPSGERVRGPTASGGAETASGKVAISPEVSAKGKGWMITVSAGEPLRASGWSFTLTASSVSETGIWDAWTDSDSCSSPSAEFESGEGYAIDPSKTIGVPGTASGVITVGAYTTKNSWTTKSDERFRRPGFSVGALTPFSSIGPTRDGRVKPEVIAPGLFIASARSQDRPSRDTDPDNYHTVLAGTSMAAPHVAGVAALMLQYGPALTPDQIRSILMEGARQDSFTGLIYPSKGSNRWGWGKVDTRTATAMFRVALLIEGLPASLSTTLKIDDVAIKALEGGAIDNIVFPRGTAHKVSVDLIVQQTPDTRYRALISNGSFLGNSMLLVNYTVQYLLTVSSPYGDPGGQGWYDAGTPATPTVAAEVPVAGALGLLGERYVFSHWVDEKGDVLSRGVVLMDSPHTVRAVWRVEFAPLQLFAIVSASLLLALYAGLRIKRGAKTHMSTRGVTCVF